MIFNFYNNEDEKRSITDPDRSDLDRPSPARARAEAVLAFAKECIRKEKDPERRVRSRPPAYRGDEAVALSDQQPAVQCNSVA